MNLSRVSVRPTFRERLSLIFRTGLVLEYVAEVLYVHQLVVANLDQVSLYAVQCDDGVEVYVPGLIVSEASGNCDLAVPPQE